MWEKPFYQVTANRRHFTVDVTLSAPPQINKPIGIMSAVLADLQRLGVESVLDFGAGKLRNTFPLLQKGFDVTACEYEGQFKSAAAKDALERAKGKNFRTLIYPNRFEASKVKYDAVLLIYVLHVIPSKRHVEHILQSCHDKLNKSGLLFCMTPGFDTNMRRHCIDRYKFEDEWVSGWILHVTEERQTFYSEPELALIKTKSSKFGFEMARQPYEAGKNRAILFKKSS